MGQVPAHLQKYVFKVGNKGGPGRKKGKNMKEFAREFLMAMSSEEKVKFMNSLEPDIVWRMAEGNPHSTEDITSGGKPFQPSIYGGLSRNKLGKKDIRPEKKDKSG